MTIYISKNDNSIIISQISTLIRFGRSLSITHCCLILLASLMLIGMSERSAYLQTRAEETLTARPGRSVPASLTGGHSLPTHEVVETTAEQMAEIIREGSQVKVEAEESEEGSIEMENDSIPDPIKSGILSESQKSSEYSDKNSALPTGHSIKPLGLAQTPTPTKSWKATVIGGYSPADAQIAVSHTHIVVTAGGAFNYYDKNGNTLGSTDALSFFSPLQPFPDPSVPNATNLPMNHLTDARCIFDSYRNRFWVTSLIGNSTSDPTMQRSILAMAVSKTEDPTGGWYYWWIYAAAGWGHPEQNVYHYGDVTDYPSIGIDPVGFHVTNMVKNDGTDPQYQGYRYWHVAIISADKLAAGQSPNGWEYWDLTNPDGSMAGLMQPVLHHGPSGRAYYVSRYGTNEVLVWAVSNVLQPSQQINRVEVTVSAFNNPVNGPQMGSTHPIGMGNLYTNPLKAVYRSGYLIFTCGDAKDWFNDGQMLSSNRLIRIFVLGFPNISPTSGTGFIDRTFGKNSSIDDAANAHVYYGWSAVEVNKNQDMVVVYNRTSTGLYPEVRFSAYLDSETDIRPSRLLKAGEAAYYYSTKNATDPLRWGDLGGAAVDPSDDTSIWVTQQYANASGGYSVWVGKVFGQ